MRRSRGEAVTEETGPDGTVLEDCRRRLDRWEPSIDAWAALATPWPEVGSQTGALANVPFAVKDVIDVGGLPTRFGSAVFAAAGVADADAAVVAALRAAGAVPVGKTRTTEFAFVDPTTTRNPYDPARTPGGSSSGSGAVVGAGIVPFALGTQTAGSLCRPAAYCGATAYKPGLRMLPTDGMAPLSPSFDAIGVIAHSFGWLARVFAVLADAFALPESAAADGPLRVGRVAPAAQTPEPAMSARLDAVADRFRAAGHMVETVDVPFDVATIIADHRTIMLQEAATGLLPLIGDAIGRIGPNLGAGLREGVDIPAAERDRALARIAEARATFWSGTGRFDLLLACPVPGAAPVGLATTGDQSYLTPWTALAGPLVSLPCGLDAAGMPLGILLAAASGRDRALMAMAARLAPLLPPTPRPVPRPAPGPTPSAG